MEINNQQLHRYFNSVEDRTQIVRGLCSKLVLKLLGVVLQDLLNFVS